MTVTLDQSFVDETRSAIHEEHVLQILSRVGLALDIPIERTTLAQRRQAQDVEDVLDPLVEIARRVGILLREVQLTHSGEIISCLHEGYAIVLAKSDGTFLVCERLVGRRVESTVIADRPATSLWRRSQLQRLLVQDPGIRIFIVKKELECDSLSGATAHATVDLDEHAHQEHPTPLRRFLSFLSLDARDIRIVAIFALVSGILALATPLAVESLVNVVSWGTYFQPLLVLATLLLVCLALAGILRVLQTIVVEIIQRRQLVRIVGDLAHRFPRANRKSFEGEYPRELANRLFDIMTIQKATAILLLDGISIALTTMVGLLLLAFYHPFLLAFDIALLLSMVSITWLLGRGGIRTAIEESIAKYKIAHWLQDVLASPTAFKINGGETLAIERANRLASEYLSARRRQFRVIIRQVAFAVGLQVVASTALLGLGGWLVIRGQLTLGQLVASELVVTIVIGAFAKAGKSFEKFYDLMAGIEKVGHLLDIPVDPRHEAIDFPSGPAVVTWSDLVLRSAASTNNVSAARIKAASRVAIVGNDTAGRSLLAKTIAGMVKPQQGAVEVGGIEAQQAALSGAGRLVAYAGQPDIFHGMLRENVDLGRSWIGQNGVRESLQQVGLWGPVNRLKQGIHTRLQSDGHPVSREETIQLMIARAIVGQPRLLVIDGIMDELSAQVRETIWESLTAKDVPWTVVIVTNDKDLANRCDSLITVNSASE